MGHLELDGLRKVYGAGDDAVVAVRGLDVTVDDGEFLVLVGPSGCGKSTTLRCIAGLEQVTGGEIRLDGRTITDEEPKDRDVAMVFQNYALYPHLSVRRNVGFGLKMRTGLSSAEIDERVTETARLLDIEELLDQKPGQLSGGQQQRVALGRAIVRDPELFLLDEPLSNLDAKLRAQMRTELQSLQHRLDVTTVYVTHDQTEAMTMGDRLAVLNAGELQQIGTPLECYYAPANRFVAGFIGSPGMNFLDVTLADGALRHSAFEYELSADLLDDLRDAGDRLVLGIRPEDVDLSTEPGDDAVAVTAEVVEPMGDVTHVYFDLDGTTYTASVAGGTVLRPGTRVHVSFPERKLYLFDRETGETVTHRPLPSDPGAVPSPPE